MGHAAAPADPAVSDFILQTEAVGKQFGKFTALRDVSAGFRSGQLTGIIGPNGAGKSTYFNMLTGAFSAQLRPHPVRGP